MAERRPKHQGLERVLGTGALFSTAYGNVGSSIYYALGLVASFALGLTPIVFLISGLIFMATAATYAEATTMYPRTRARKMGRRWRGMRHHCINLRRSRLSYTHESEFEEDLEWTRKTQNLTNGASRPCSRPRPTRSSLPTTSVATSTPTPPHSH